MANTNKADGSPSQKDQPRIDEYIQLGIKVFGSFAGAAGLLFALGFLVVNISLLKHGVYEINLLRERYISSGTAFILFLAIIAISWVFIIDKFLVPKFKGRLSLPKSWSFIVVVKVVALGLALFLLFVLLITFISLLATLLLGFIWKISTDPKDWGDLIRNLNDSGFWNQSLNTLESTFPVFFWCLFASIIFVAWRIFHNWEKFWTIKVSSDNQNDTPENNREQTNDLARTQKSSDSRVDESKSHSNQIFIWFLLRSIISGLWWIIRNWKEIKPDKNSTDNQEDSLVIKEELSDNKNGDKSILKIIEENWVYFLVTILLFFSLVVYARNVFPVLPAAMGGGLPIVVQFSTKEIQEMEEFIQLGILADENKPDLTRQVTLIAQTSNAYIVLVPDPVLKQDVAVSIPKEQVHGIIYYPEEYFLNDEYVAEKHTQIGLDLFDRGDYPSAEDEFTLALRREEDYIPAMIGLGDVYVSMYIAEDIPCDSIDCNLLKAIKEYKDAIKILADWRKDSDQKTGNFDNAQYAKAHYKLSKAFALNKPEENEEFICDHPETENEKVEDTGKPPIDALACAIEWDESAENQVGYRELAKREEAFHFDGNYGLRTDEDFLLLLFPTLIDAMSWHSQEANNLSQAGKFSDAELMYTWPISITAQYSNTEEIKDDYSNILAQHSFNRGSFYLDLLKQEEVAGIPEQLLGSALNNAINDYEKANELVFNNPNYLTKLADAYRQDESRLNDAIAVYQEVIDLEDYSDFAQAWLGLGESYLLKRNFVTARDIFSSTLTLQPDNAFVHYGRARAESALGNVEQAKLHLRRAIGLNDTLLNLALQEETLELLREDINNLLSASQLYQAGLLLEGEGKLKDAITNYSQAKDLDPDNALYHAILANIYTQLPTPSWSDAEEQYKLAVSLAIDNDYYIFRLGEVYAAQGKYDDAIDKFERAITLNPENASYFNSLSNAYLQNEDLENAITAQENAVGLDPQNPYLLFRLAEVYRLDGRLDRARQIFQEIIEIKDNPYIGDAHCGLAIVYFQSSQPGIGEKAYNNCSSTDQSLLDQAKFEYEKNVNKETSEGTQ